MVTDIKKVAVGLIPRLRKDGQTEYLFVNSKHNFGKYTGLFYPPGGHVEDNEKPEGALKREIFEELSIEVDIVEKLDESPGDVPNQITLWYLCKALPSNIKIRLDHNEIENVLWISESELDNNRGIFWPATWIFLTKYLRNKNFHN